MINLKAEIIYFKCTTDFEFEFNLNTAVQMRLFTECPADDKAFLGALSLAVSRSRAIIITSKFDEALITKLAGAIGFNTAAINPAEYGITQMETDKLITGGVPLVTNDGVYAGIILESGPQSLIIITNERATRRRLMSELVHTYLIDVANTAVTAAPITTEKVDTTVCDNTVTDETVDEVVEESVDDVVDDVVDDEIDTDDNSVTEIIEAVNESDDDNIGDENGNDTDDNITEVPIDFDLGTDDETTDEVPSLKQKRNTNIFTAILAVILFLLVAFIVYSLVIDPFINDISIEENFKHIFGFLFE